MCAFRAMPMSHYCLTCCEMLCSECLAVHLAKNCNTCAIRTMETACTEMYQNLSLRLQAEIDDCKKERQNVAEMAPKVQGWMERAKHSLAELKQSFVTEVVEKVFNDCEENIEKHGASIDVSVFYKIVLYCLYSFSL